MKILRMLFVAGIFVFATGCTEEVISPNNDQEDEDTPVVVGDPDDDGSSGG